MSERTDPVQIRLATAADLLTINQIYNYYVATSTCTYQKDPSTEAERAAWFAEHDARHPVTVAEQAGQIVGWGSLSDYRVRWGYRYTVENSVYVRHDAQRCGIGRALLLDLVERARALGYHTIIAGISAEQLGSIRLHEQAGFTPAGQVREVGHKFERWLDVLFMQRFL
jgi:phosphinothricin acetyltransferase